MKINLPKQNFNENDSYSEKEKRLKDDLMNLIIDTKDEDMALKITGDDYRRIGIHDEWRNVSADGLNSAYFSYQEKAAKDFIFRFNKCGILSDQVGMGKTIEAGMIISELAYRKELGSLLILVPNETMAQKWMNELAKKFGFRNLYKDVTVIKGNEEKVVSQEKLPKVACVREVNDFYTLIFEAWEQLKNKKESLNAKIKALVHKYYNEIVTQKDLDIARSQLQEKTRKNSVTNSKEFKLYILKEFYSPMINKFVSKVAEELGYLKEFKASNYEMPIDGNYYHIVDMLFDTNITDGILVNGIMSRIYDVDLIANSLIDEFGFIKAKLGKDIIDKINKRAKNAKVEEDRIGYVNDLRSIANQIKEIYSILIVSKRVQEGKENILLLDYVLNTEFESESNKYCSVSSIANHGYKVIDMLIDMAYTTLIVDEAHDYIKVSHLKPIEGNVAKIRPYNINRYKKEFNDLELNGESGPGLKYNVFPLFGNYYFVDKDCLYVKLKELADRSFRKIFMTATPIKSDMIDFYLLYLLADNQDASTYRKIRTLISEDKVSKIAELLLSKLAYNQLRSLNYMNHQDLVVRYIYNVYKQEKDKSGFDDRIMKIVDNAIKTRVVNSDALDAACVNEARTKFQDLFTIDGQEIQTISELVASEKGIMQWQNMYSQLGIRSTRHQTFKLDETNIGKIIPAHRIKYQNLPLWSRRNGTVIYIYRNDNFFDTLVRNKLREKQEERDNREKDTIFFETVDEKESNEITALEKEYEEKVQEINLNEEGQTEQGIEEELLKARDERDEAITRVKEKYIPLRTAHTIFDYINEQLTGQLNHADYFATEVDYLQFKLHMVSMLMTDGLMYEQDGEAQVKKISGKVLLFADKSTQKEVYKWLDQEVNNTKNVKMDAKALEEYKRTYSHEPVWHYNLSAAREEDKWHVTTDIKSLNEKKGNYLIVVEPDKYEEGVDLQSSNTLINFDIKFSPLNMEQRIGRIDRVKLGEKQSNLDIISFTPLNDISGFMVDFLANELEMFSCWRGDTTGIVSLPISEKENSATFENMIEVLNDAYISLYKLDNQGFKSSFGKLIEIAKSINNNSVIDANLLERGYSEKDVDMNFDYLSRNKKYLNTIINNTRTGKTGQGDIMGTKEVIGFGLLHVVSGGGHNDIKALREAINSYFDENIKYYTDHLNNLTPGKSQKGGIGTNISGQKLQAEKIKVEQLVKAYKEEKEKYNATELSSTKSSAVLKVKVEGALADIKNRYSKTINEYLDKIITVFDGLCDNVKNKSLMMSKLISFVTVEELKGMALNYEQE